MQVIGKAKHSNPGVHIDKPDILGRRPTEEIKQRCKGDLLDVADGPRTKDELPKPDMFSCDGPFYLIANCAGPLQGTLFVVCEHELEMIPD